MNMDQVTFEMGFKGWMEYLDQGAKVGTPQGVLRRWREQNMNSNSPTEIKIT